MKKLRSTSKKDVVPFSFDEKLRSTSEKDVDSIYFYFFLNQFCTCKSLKLRNRL